MRNFAMCSFAAAALACAISITPSIAATSTNKIVVTLDGEADQPMQILVNKPTVKAGLVEFKVANVAIGTDHEVVLVKLPNKDAKLIADPKTQRIDEKKLKSMGEVSGLKPGDKGTLKVKLAPGSYVLVCNHEKHYELGMATPFTVTN
jgi:uncharacterized cupredoxin-like copper-binding protein